MVVTTKDLDLFSPGDVYDLTGKVAVVTGAGDGIGRAIARLLARAGAQVVCADITGKTAATVDLIHAAGGSALARHVDVSSQAKVEAMIDQTVEGLGAVDILVNNAAIIETNCTAEVDEAALDRHIAVNMKGVFFCCQAAARIMARQGSGSIINVASTAIDLGLPQTVAYSMCKAAVAQLTKCLAVEVGKQGVRVNTIAPGFVVTPMTSRHFTNADGSIDEVRKAAVVAELSNGLALKDAGESVDIAHMALFLASPASRHVTGQIMRPNGGISMPW